MSLEYQTWVKIRCQVSHVHALVEKMTHYKFNARLFFDISLNFWNFQSLKSLASRLEGTQSVYYVSTWYLLLVQSTHVPVTFLSVAMNEHFQANTTVIPWYCRRQKDTHTYRMTKRRL